MSDFSCTSVVGVNFELTARYSEPQPVELDAFGLMCSAKDSISHQLVAIKKLAKPFGSAMLAKQALRELKLSTHLQHENIIGLVDVFISPKEDLYIVTELMWTNLQRIIGKGPIDNDFSKYFLYQIMRGLKYVHSAGIIHRDLKPSSILINENCDLRIGDFGHARLRDHQMTGYVSTRYYRAPEIMLTWQEYTEKVDIWSTGCIFAEMLRGVPLFPATSHADQFSLFVKLLGNPEERMVETIKNKHTRSFVQSLPKCKRESLPDVFPDLDQDAMGLLEQMLNFDVEIRTNARDALSHPYLAPYHDPEDEPVVKTPFDWSFDNAEVSIETWKAAIYKEVVLFRQQALRSRRPVNIRDAIINATKGHVMSTVTPVTTDTESDEASLFGEGKFDDALSSFCNDFHS
ncbi:mitogen-activated protein kinase Hog1 [Penicillium atrosanguineum]|uniref:mitogen-activated protein kinase n=1 Tax=Penicillium atrosanguineum TaxID=1132637 RepID=A0A9W9KU22_9EURO|nr:mitogen-activated protein kinase Hog1 [Penicillium atrosanguineum]KAJ5119977.1 mitogen-activated protein kinase Hog1 [Penicillium atrosanguineum]KAJ5299736.1 mitogen-activated protein kinase Hog1 [Penicillium atrosanguineum]